MDKLEKKPKEIDWRKKNLTDKLEKYQTIMRLSLLNK